MPLPEQARYTPRGITHEEGILERTFNRLPHFVQYGRRVHAPATDTEIDNTNPTLMTLNSEGSFAFTFEKYETWTDVLVEFELSGYAPTVSARVNTKMIFRDEAGVDTDSLIVARFVYNIANVNLQFSGSRRVRNLPPGVYSARPMWWVSANRFIVPAADATVTVTAEEVIPVPADYDVG